MIWYTFHKMKHTLLKTDNKAIYLRSNVLYALSATVNSATQTSDKNNNLENKFVQNNSGQRKQQKTKMH